MNIYEKVSAMKRNDPEKREESRRFWLIAACVSSALYAIAGIFTAWVLARQ